MAGGKETPRQKMIGMMYLVLTALLALNVSKEIINAFVTQDNQMLVTNNNLVEGINGTMAKFSMLAVDPTTKKTFEKWKPKAQKVNTLANSLDDFLLDNLNQMMEKSEKKKDWFVKSKENQYTTWQPIETIQNKEDYDIATRMFGGEKNSEGYKKGGEIRQRLLQLRDSLILTMGNYTERGKQYTVKKQWLTDAKTLENQLDTTHHPDKLKLLSIYQMLYQPEKLKNHDKDQDWQLVKFDYQPIVGAIGVFTELRNQVRMAQQKALELIFSKTNGQIMKINKIEPQLIATTRYLNQGDTLGVKVGIIAYDSTATYPIKYQIGSQELTSENNQFTLRASSVGQQTVKGSLVLDLADGKKEFPWSFDYTVGKPVGSISIPEYNVLYANYNNFIETSFSGYSSSDVQASCPQCESFTKQGNGYIARVRKGTSPEIIVKAKDSRLVRKYSVKPLPKPVFTFLNQTEGRLNSGKRNQANVVNVENPPSSILSVKYDVSSFKMEVITNGRLVEVDESQSRALTNKMKSAIRNLRRGDRIIFTDITYKPQGATRSIPYGSEVSFKAG